MDVEPKSEKQKEPESFHEIIRTPVSITTSFDKHDYESPLLMIVDILDKILMTNEGADLTKTIRRVVNELSQMEEKITNLTGIEWDQKKQMGILTKAQQQLNEKGQQAEAYAELPIFKKTREEYYQKRMKQILEFR
jgi:hypothetical protein